MSVRWFVSRSAVRGNFKKPKPGPWSGYFYDGPTRHFGHSPPRGSKAKG